MSSVALQAKQLGGEPSVYLSSYLFTFEAVVFHAKSDSSTFHS